MIFTIGLRLGYKKTSFDQKELDSGKGTYKGDLTNSGTAFGTQIGLRYQISDTFAIQAEYATVDETGIIQGELQSNSKNPCEVKNLPSNDLIT